MRQKISWVVELTLKCIDHTVTPNQGSMVLHCGKLRHSGATITSGTRYILIGFLDIHSIALEDVRKDLKKNLQTDKAWLDTLWKPLRHFFVNDVIQLRGYKNSKSGSERLALHIRSKNSEDSVRD